MAAGRRPTPNALKLLNGNPGKRPLNANEPKPAPIAPKCPGHLDAAARREWKRIGPELESLGLLTRIDMAALAAYCQSYSRWIEAEKMIRKHGMLIKSPNGYPQVSPFLTVVNKSIDQMRAFLTEFGMTPAARSRIDVKPVEDKDDMESLLSGIK